MLPELSLLPAGGVSLAVAPAPSAPVHVDPFWIAVVSSGWAKGLALVWGAIWGSFASVVIHRLPRGESIVRPRSRCTACGRPLRAVENVPILSFLLLRGRCRGCKAPYGTRYVVLELAAAALSLALYVQDVALPLLGGGGIQLATYLLHFAFAWALLVVTYIDLDVWVIPDEVVLPVAAAGMIAGALDPNLLGVDPWHAAAAAAAAYGVFAGIRWFYLRFRNIEGLGLGDAKLLVMVAVFLGPGGVLWTVGAGALQGLLVSVPLLLSGRSVANTDLEEVHGDDPLLGREDPEAGIGGRRVPFGPFLALAALEFLFFRPQIERVAGHLLGLP